MIELKTGEICVLAGRYQFQRYVDGKFRPNPTNNEMIIPLDRGDRVPPVHSVNAGAVYRRISH